MKKCDDNRSELARGRWRLLRTALLGRDVAINQQEDFKKHSINRFAGYNLVPATPVCTADDVSAKRLLENLLMPWKDNKVPVENGIILMVDDDKKVDVNARAERLMLSLLAASALDPNCPSVQILCSDEESSRLIETFVKQGQFSTVSVQGSVGHQVLLRVALQREKFQIKRYEISANSFIFTRERITPSRLSLQELTSHHHHQQVDNTGNICVWDSEKTLTWFLHNSWTRNHIHDGDVKVVFEVGAGMAGLAALSLAGKAGTIYLTDGHEDCVWNNRINVSVLEAAALTSDRSEAKGTSCRTTRVHCSLLKWGYVGDSLCQADYTLASDCTHFYEWHGQLLWTLLKNTRVGGYVWLCQPDRGNSLNSFLDVVRCLKDCCNIIEQNDATLDAMYEKFVENDPNFDPSLHRPRIFCLEKKRRVIDVDRIAIQRHIIERDQ